MGKAVEHTAALCDFRNGAAVILLVKEKAGFLSVLHIHGIIHTVFADFGNGRGGVFIPIPALVLLHSLKLTDGNIVSLEYAVYPLAIRAKHGQKLCEQLVLYALHADGENLRDKDI